MESLCLPSHLQTTLNFWREKKKEKERERKRELHKFLINNLLLYTERIRKIICLIS